MELDEEQETHAWKVSVSCHGSYTHHHFRIKFHTKLLSESRKTATQSLTHCTILLNKYPFPTPCSLTQKTVQSQGYLAEIFMTGSGWYLPTTLQTTELVHPLKALISQIPMYVWCLLPSKYPTFACDRLFLVVLY